MKISVSVRSSSLLIAALTLILTACGNGDSKPGAAAKNVSMDIGAPEPSISIHEAALTGMSAQVMEMINNGATVDTLDEDGRTPLMYASFNGYTGLIRNLLDKGASINLQDKLGRTALMMASSGPFTESVRLLLERDADPNITDYAEHFTALMYAASEGQLETIKLLLSNNGDASLKDVDGEDALAFARNNGHTEIVVLLQSLKKK